MGPRTSHLLHTAMRGIRRLLRPLAPAIRRWREKRPAYEAQLFYHSGLLTILRRRALRGNRSFSILMYHSIGQSHLKNPVLCVSERNFDGHIRYLSRHYQVLSLDLTVALMKEGAPFPENAVVITFDDGYRDNYERAFPILKKHHCTATVFVATDPLETGRWLWQTRLYFWLMSTTERELRLRLAGKDAGVDAGEPRRVFDLGTPEKRQVAYWSINSHLRTLLLEDREVLLGSVGETLGFDPKSASADVSPMATWDQLREMSNAGITIGSHTMTHPVLTSLRREDVWRELVESKAVIERRVGRRAGLFAYPFGLEEHFDSEIRAMVQRAGYVAACAAIEGSNSPGADVFALRRLYIPDEPPAIFARRLLDAVGGGRRGSPANAP